MKGLRNTQLLELSKCRTKTLGLNIILFKGALLWINCQIILRKQNPLNISKKKTKTNTGMDREIMYLLYLLLNCLLFKNVHM